MFARIEAKFEWLLSSKTNVQTDELLQHTYRTSTSPIAENVFTTTVDDVIGLLDHNISDLSERQLKNLCNEVCSISTRW